MLGGFDWNPLSWIQSAGNIASSAISDVENWAKNAIKLAVDALSDAVSLVTDGIEALDTALVAGFQSITSLAENTYNWAAQIAYVDLPDAVNGLFNTALGWVDDAEGLAEQLYNAAIGYATDVVDDVTNALDYALNNYLYPAWNWIGNAENWVGALLDSWWDAIWANTFGPIWSAMQWLAGLGADWFDWLTNVATDAINAVIKAWEWIVWFGEHTIDDLVNLVDSTPSQIDNAFLNSAVAQVPGAFEEAEEWFSQILGA